LDDYPFEVTKSELEGPFEFAEVLALAQRWDLSQPAILLVGTNWFLLKGRNARYARLRANKRKKQRRATTGRRK
jgi:hypothetical protein